MIIPFAKDRVVTEDIIIASDWDNSYQISSSLKIDFDLDCEYISFLNDTTEEWYQACSDFDDKWEQFQI